MATLRSADYLVICPFYKASDYKTFIRCESPAYHSTSIVIRFRSKNRLMQHMTKYCREAKACEECNVHKANMFKYN